MSELNAGELEIEIEEKRWHQNQSRRTRPRGTSLHFNSNLQASNKAAAAA